SVLLSQLRPPTSTLFPSTTLFRSWYHSRGLPAHRPGFSYFRSHPPAPVRRTVSAGRSVLPGRRRLRRTYDLENESPMNRNDWIEIGRATSELQSRENLVCRLLLEK